MHLTGAAVGGGVFASFCLGTGLAQPEELAVLVAMSTIGGILPDIDLDQVLPLQATLYQY